jgi:uncharacterized protein
MQDLTSPLSEEELDELADFLDSLPSPKAMNIEELDGFLCAIISGPVTINPAEALSFIVGASAQELAEQPVFATDEQAMQIMELILRHWNTIAGTLGEDGIHLPVLLLNEENGGRGNDWAWGFLTGVEVRKGSWDRLMHSETDAEFILPVIALAYENHPDKELRVEPKTPDERDELLHLMTAYLVKIYRYFESERLGQAPVASAPIIRAGPKVGRNDPCPCGSGKKYKVCCMRTIH